MKTKTTPIILSNVMISEMNKALTFREITEPDELERVFWFRYVEYSRSRLCPILKQNAQMIDLDVFDLHSRHFGLFNHKNELAGCFRVVLDRSEYYNSKVFEIGKRNVIFTNSLHSKDSLKSINEADFPFLSYPNLPEIIMSHYLAKKENNESFAEGSRLVIREDVRGLRTSSFLIDCIMMLLIHICSGRKHSILDCREDHCAFYERYGFRPFVEGTEYRVHNMVINVMYLPSTLSSMSAHFKLKFEAMANEFSKTHKISRAI
jgi:predicted GNAT family N-acyltransferase